jgi:outer membrane beta-barrel protein
MRQLAYALPGKSGPASRPAADARSRPWLALALAATIGLAALPARRTLAAEQGRDIEELFNSEDAKEGANAVEAKPPQAPQASAPAGSADQTDASAKKNGGKINKLSDLSGLSPFSDIAVIQKRFLPKTKRYELFGGASTILNDPFFFSVGLNARFGYYFRERWGVEFLGSILSTSQRDITKGLQNRLVTTSSLVTPVSYLGLDAKWVPIYGKMTLLNRNIVPFDLYFSLGLGATGTNQGSEAPTAHLGTGQAFALNKSLALRWDFSVNIYSSTSGTDPTKGAAIYNDVFLTVGASFFFPEATYR